MRVLYLTHRLPFAPNRGDRIRSFHLLEGLRAAADVSLVSLVHDAAEAGEAWERPEWPREERPRRKRSRLPRLY